VIQFRIQKARIDRNGHDALVSMKMMKVLREAGVPVIGHMSMRGVERGSLTYSSPGEEHVITWKEDKDDKDKLPVVESFKPGWDHNDGSVTIRRMGRHAAEDDDL
jgi:hypothetical protein